MKRKVCLFGLSANPPTGESGHLGIIRHLATQHDFDEIRVLPVYSHMFANKRNSLASFEQRYEMCQLAFGDVPKVTVSLAEKECFEKASANLSENEISSVRVGTADLLDMLLVDEPNSLFTLTLGRDTFMDLTNWKWRRSKDILHLLEARLLVIHRLPSSLSKNEESDQIENDTNLEQLNRRVFETNNSIRKDKSQNLSSEPIKVIQIPSLSNVSSSLVRSTSNCSFLSQLVSPEVLEYMQKHKLYAFNE